jgi:hypothetical protein
MKKKKLIFLFSFTLNFLFLSFHSIPDVKKDEILNNTTRSELSFSPTVEDDGKFMVCRAENPVVSGLFLESTWKLSVVCEYFSLSILRLLCNVQQLFNYSSSWESLLSASSS